MKPKAMKKLKQYPGLFDAQRLHSAQDLFDFDNVFTAPLHGFANTANYWSQASAKPHLAHITVPTLVLNALNDPFVPARSLPDPRSVSKFVSLWQPDNGGHVGFNQAASAGPLSTLPDVVGGWLMRGGPDYG
jgi:predicted alpha/beta-fold hydrolase